jgi:hypothetical protein
VSLVRVAAGRDRWSWLAEGTVTEVVRVTREETPDDTSTHLTTRALAARLGIGKETVARIWRDHDLKPWRVETFKASNDPRSKAARSRPHCMSGRPVMHQVNPPNDPAFLSGFR